MICIKIKDSENNTKTRNVRKGVGEAEPISVVQLRRADGTRPHPTPPICEQSFARPNQLRDTNRCQGPPRHMATDCGGLGSAPGCLQVEEQHGLRAGPEAEGIATSAHGQ